MNANKHYVWIERVRKTLPYFDEINVEKLDELERKFAQKEANKKAATVSKD